MSSRVPGKMRQPRSLVVSHVNLQATAIISGSDSDSLSGYRNTIQLPDDRLPLCLGGIPGSKFCGEAKLEPSATSILPPAHFSIRLAGVRALWAADTVAESRSPTCCSYSWWFAREHPRHPSSRSRRVAMWERMRIGSEGTTLSIGLSSHNVSVTAPHMALRPGQHYLIQTFGALTPLSMVFIA